MAQSVLTRFDALTMERLTNLCKLTGKTKSYYIKEAVNEKLEDLELLYIGTK